MVNPVFTAAAIQRVVGNSFDVNENRSTNGTGFVVSIKVDVLKTLVRKDSKKVKLMFAAIDALQKAGYPVSEEDFRLSNRDRKNPEVYTSWLHCWVNQPQAQATVVDTSSVVTATKATSELARFREGMVKYQAALKANKSQEILETIADAYGLFQQPEPTPAPTETAQTEGQVMDEEENPLGDIPG